MARPTRRAIIRRAPASPASYPRALVASQLARVRALCRQLPGVVERPSHGSPAFLIDGKHVLAYFLDNHHGDGRLALWCAAPDGAQAMLVDNNPDGYFVPPYVGHRGWLGVRLDRGLHWDELDGIAEDAYAVVAPPRLVEAARQSASS